MCIQLHAKLYGKGNCYCTLSWRVGEWGGGGGGGGAIPVRHKNLIRQKNSCRILNTTLSGLYKHKKIAFLSKGLSTIFAGSSPYTTINIETNPDTITVTPTATGGCEMGIGRMFRL